MIDVRDPPLDDICDRAAFGHLVERYQRRVYAAALHILGNHGDADDVTQETFIRAYRGLATFDGPGRGVDAAMTLVRDATALGLSVRAGLHTGEIVVNGDDVSGVAVHLASRIESAAEPGTVLVSSTVVDLVVGSNHDFTPAGRRTFAGIAREWDVFIATR